MILKLYLFVFLTTVTVSVVYALSMNPLRLKPEPVEKVFMVTNTSTSKIDIYTIHFDAHAQGINVSVGIDCQDPLYQEFVREMIRLYMSILVERILDTESADLIVNDGVFEDDKPCSPYGDLLSEEPYKVPDLQEWTCNESISLEQIVVEELKEEF